MPIQKLKSVFIIRIPTQIGDYIGGIFGDRPKADKELRKFHKAQLAYNAESCDLAYLTEFHVEYSTPKRRSNGSKNNRK